MLRRTVGEDGAVLLTIIGGNPPYTILDDTTNFLGGDYTISVQDSLGCTTSGDFTVGVPDAITYEIDITNATGFGNNDGSVDITLSGGTPPYTIIGDTTGLAS